MDIESLVLGALKTKTMRERLRQRLSGGFTPVQLFHRLSLAQQRHLLSGEANGEVASRKAMAQLQRALDGLEDRGQVHRKKVKMQTQDGRGPRTIMVDVYRLPRRPS